MTVRVTFWGTRGSIPAPGPATARYGGNTPSVEVRTGTSSDHVVILDAGTGIRALGHQLTGDSHPVRADLLVTHTHWDHIQGLPFFVPFFDAETTVRIWGAPQAGVALEEILRNQMSPVVFPVPLDGVAAELAVNHVDGQEFEVDGFRVEALRVRHPGTTFGYRLTPKEGGASVVYVPDNELGEGPDYDVPADWRRQFVSFLDGADVLVHDAMYTSEELERHRGWGHSSHLEAVEVAAEAGVSQLVLFHHRPEHDDAKVDEMLQEAQAAAPDAMEVVAAQEGMELELSL